MYVSPVPYREDAMAITPSMESDRLLKLMYEMKSLLIGRPISPFAVVKKEFGLKGNNEEVYSQFLDILVEKGILVDSGHDRIHIVQGGQSGGNS